MNPANDADPVFFDSAEEALSASAPGASAEQRARWLGWLEAKEAFESRDEDSDPRDDAFLRRPPPEPASPEQAANWLGWLATKADVESRDEASSPPPAPPPP
ncbi:MAG: hypothetical protein D6731_24845, partial [Planctomycetota bacterium]